MPKTIENYTNERNELLQKMINILGISKENNMISLKKMDENIELQNKILELIPDIKKYFLCSRWTLFSNKNREIKREYLSLIKSVMKDMDVNFESKRTSKKISENVREWEYIYIIKL